jgi:hypothetical protein
MCHLGPIYNIKNDYIILNYTEMITDNIFVFYSFTLYNNYQINNNFFSLY